MDGKIIQFKDGIPVTCIDDTFRPADIPLSLWVVKENDYTVMSIHQDMNGVTFFQLKELDITKAGTQYKGYASTRFKEKDDLIAELI